MAIYGQSDTHKNGYSSDAKIGATPTTFYLPHWKPLGFVTLFTDGSGSISSYIYSYDTYE